jgi:rubrerythrin
MSTLRALLRRVLGSETVLCECRNCGTSLDQDTEQCPECRAVEVATYHLKS